MPSTPLSLGQHPILTNKMDGTFHVPLTHRLNSNRRAELGGAVHGVQQPLLQLGEGQEVGHGVLGDGGQLGGGVAVGGLV